LLVWYAVISGFEMKARRNSLPCAHRSILRFEFITNVTASIKRVKFKEKHLYTNLKCRKILNIL